MIKFVSLQNYSKKQVHVYEYICKDIVLLGNIRKSRFVFVNICAYICFVGKYLEKRVHISRGMNEGNKVEREK